MTPRPRRTLLTAATAATLLTLTGCGSPDPLATESPEEEAGGAGAGENPGQSLVVGSQQYYSNEIISELYAQALESDGYTVDRQYQIGQREVYMPEVESGAIDVFPEYSGALLQYLDDSAEAASPEEVYSALQEATPEGLRVLQPAEATDQDSFNVTQEFAEQHDLSSIGELANVDEDLSIAANSEFETRPYGPEGLREVYGVDVTLVPVEDSGGPLTVQALLDGTVEIADIYTASPAIQQNDLVTLEDPENLVLPQNVTPLVSDNVDEQAAETIESVNAELTTEELIELNTQSQEEQAASADLADEWLTEKGLN